MLLSEFINLKEKPGCNMTEEGRGCAVHGMNECPGYKMIETSTQEKLHQQHQEIRKKSGLPNPNYYKELRATFDLPHKERFARVAELKKKYKIKEQEITGHGQFTTKDMGGGTKVSFDPASGAKTISGAGGTTTYNTQGQKTAYQTPTVGGTSQTTNFQTGEKTTTMNQGPVSASITQRPDQSKVTSTSAQLGDVAVSAHQGVGFGGAGKDVGQGGNVISTITNPQGKTASYAGRIPTSQEIGAAINEKDLEEAGPFSYGAKKPRKGSVADLAAKKRKEQEKDKQPAEPRDHMVGVARVVKDVAEGSGITKLNDYNQWSDRVDAQGAEKHMQKNRTLIVAQSWDGERVGEFDTRANQGWVMTQGISEGAGEKLLSKMIPGGASAFNALDAVRRYKSGDKVGAGIAAAGTIPITSIPAAAVDMARDKYYTGSFLPSDEQRDLANLNRQVADMEKQQWTKMPDGSERSPDGRTIRGPITKAPDEITNEGIEQYLEELSRAGYEVITETAQPCPECGGPAFSDQLLAEKKDACYSKVKSRYKVWPSAYASGALVRCRKVGAKNWGNKSKK